MELAKHHGSADDRPTLAVVVVGAVYQDVILHVDRFPDEDTKKRAQRVEYRRGGNGGNTLAVLAQLHSLAPAYAMQLSMAAAFPGSPPAAASSPPDAASPPPPSDPATLATSPVADLLSRSVHLGASVFRGPGTPQPAAFIIATPTSRTIINQNDLHDLQAAEFSARALPRIEACLRSHPRSRAWVHFEGRSVDQISGMAAALHGLRRALADPHIPDALLGRLTISIEFEKPDRDGLAELLPLADVCFFSKLWAARHGPAAASEDQARTPALYLAHLAAGTSAAHLAHAVAPHAHLFATWGEAGAYYARAASAQPTSTDAAPVAHAPAPPIAAVDTIGAGDTFIAGTIFGMAALHLDGPDAARFAVRLASAKCAQHGFDGIEPAARHAAAEIASASIGS
ncbi:hypothetical protein HK105_206723 [Polyrhizophydium stewartii]|uniref:Carbohydrate kinase PfkB domain-containing protein n=1 Tax=Polyrhizophydium stewartii TaxID=2732419 RepID=A0ABR4N2E5_9FUNG|nr:hypothetical protein HK105_000187 [Polyrhizophydium stewartii]